jgi:hypothetical protein
MKYWSAIIFLSIAIAPVASQATTIGQSLGESQVSITGPRFLDTTTEKSEIDQTVRTVVLEQFDPSLGVLDSVQIYLQANVGNLFFVQHDSDREHSFNVETEAVFSAFWDGATRPLQNKSILTETAAIAPQSAGPQTSDFMGATFGEELFELTGPAAAPFVGGDTLAIELTLDLSATVSTEEDVRFSIGGRDAFTGVGFGFLTYNYTEVPDDMPPPVIPLPGGLPLLATALGLGALLRRRRR